MNAPHLAHVAAFFDLDSTILPAPSLEWRFIGYLLERNQLKSAGATAWLARFAKNILRSPREATEANKRYLAGLRESLARDFSLAHREAENLSHASATGAFFPEALSRISWHQSQSHRVCIVSGTLAVLAREINDALPAPIDIIATELETAPAPVHPDVTHGLAQRDRAAFDFASDSGLAPVSAQIFTGQLSGPHMTGLAKARALWHYAETHAIDLAHSYAYGDRNSDLPMLDAVGHPVAVNPSKRLARIARENQWDTAHWGLAAEPARHNAKFTPQKNAAAPPHGAAR